MGGNADPFLEETVDHQMTSSGLLSELCTSLNSLPCIVIKKGVGNWGGLLLENTGGLPV
jgi:hypothetical protein